MQVAGVYRRLDVGVGDIFDIGVTFIDIRDLAAVEVEGYHLETGASELHGEGKAHIAKPDDTHDGCAVRDLAGKALLMSGFRCVILGQSVFLLVY
jgi:hypothetical protein